MFPIFQLIFLKILDSEKHKLPENHWEEISAWKSYARQTLFSMSISGVTGRQFLEFSSKYESISHSVVSEFRNINIHHCKMVRNMYVGVCPWKWRPLSRVWLSATPQTIFRWAPLSVGILQARILEWVVIPFSRNQTLESNPGINPGIKPRPPTLQVDSLLSEPPGKPPSKHEPLAPLCFPHTQSSECRFKYTLNYHHLSSHKVSSTTSPGHDTTVF